MTWSAVNRELTSADGFLFLDKPKPPSEFLTQYVQLRKLALRAKAMTAAERLAPADAVKWAVGVGLVEIPAQLLQLVSPDPRIVAVSVPMDSPVVQKDIAQEPPPKGLVEPQPINPEPKRTIKKSALMRKYGAVWATMESDFRHSNENGLANEAKAPSHGHWVEDAALAWAKQNGKLVEAKTSSATLMTSLTGRIHRSDD